jgi:hypothetical protein
VAGFVLHKIFAAIPRETTLSSTTAALTKTHTTFPTTNFITMKFLKTTLAFSVLLFAPVSAQNKEADAMRDLQLGLQGIQEAAKNPALLAQLMQDLQVCVRGMCTAFIWDS